MNEQGVTLAGGEELVAVTVPCLVIVGLPCDTSGVTDVRKTRPVLEAFQMTARHFFGRF